MPGLPPIQYSGFNFSNFNPTLTFIYDSGAGESGAYRALRPSDLAGGGGGGGGDASAANQTTQIGIEQNILGSVNDIEGLLSGVSSKLTSGITTSLPFNVPSGTRFPITNLPSGQSGVNGTFTFNQDNGALVTQIPNLERTADTVTAYTPASSTLISGNIPGIRTGIGTILNANQRNVIFLQNVGVNPILCALTGTASLTNFNFVLKGGTTLLDGNGASWSSDSWYGGLSVSGSGISYTSFEY